MSKTLLDGQPCTNPGCLQTLSHACVCGRVGGRNMIDRFIGPWEFLSNFHVHPMAFGRYVYPAVENVYQMAKAKTRTDLLQSEFTAMTPGQAKKAGRHLEMREDWDNVKFAIMYQLLITKFAEPQMMARLLSTGATTLIEGNTWNDRIWGCVQDQNGQWQGDNWLGRLLMLVRAQGILATARRQQQ